MIANLDWSELPPTDIRRLVAWVCVQAKSMVTFPVFESFSDIVGIVDRDLYYKCAHVHFMYMGKLAGWWELSWDIFGAAGDLYPIQLKIISMKETSASHFPALLAELGLFKSSSEAKKNGWNKFLELGDFFFKKKTYILRIVD